MISVLDISRNISWIASVWWCAKSDINVFLSIYLWILPTLINSVFIMFGAMHFIYYINRSIATKVDSTYLGILTYSTQRICLVARGGRELVTFRLLSQTLSLYTTRLLMSFFSFCYEICVFCMCVVCFFVFCWFQ